MGDYLLRLALVLPLICGLAVACLFLLRRSPWGARLATASPSAGLRLVGQRWQRTTAHAGPPAAPGEGKAKSTGTAALHLLQTRRLSPTAALALVRFHDQDLLLSVTPAGIAILDRAGSLDAPAPAAAAGATSLAAPRVAGAAAPVHHAAAADGACACLCPSSSSSPGFQTLLGQSGWRADDALPAKEPVP